MLNTYSTPIRITGEISMSEKRKQGKKSYNVTNPNKIRWIETRPGDFIYKFRDYKVIVERSNSLNDRRTKYSYRIVGPDGKDIVSSNHIYSYFNKAAGKALIEFRNLYGLRGNY